MDVGWWAIISVAKKTTKKPFSPSMKSISCYPGLSNPYIDNLSFTTKKPVTRQIHYSLLKGKTKVMDRICSLFLILTP